MTNQLVKTATATIALGSNMASRFGPPDATVQHAMVEVSAALGPITGKSQLYVTACFPAGAGPDFINAVITLDTKLPPDKVLSCLHKIEADFGRERAVRWGQRTLDLDLLNLGNAVLPDAETHATWRHLEAEAQSRTAPDQLILPHPRVQDRAFVLVPWADVSPDWIHPILGQSVQEMLEALPKADIDGVIPHSAHPD